MDHLLRPLLLLLLLVTWAFTVGCSRDGVERNPPLGAAPLPPESRGGAEAAAPTHPPTTLAAPADCTHLTCADCLRLALASNRQFLIRHSQLHSARFAETVAWSQVYAPQANATYLITNHQDSATAGIAPSPLAPATNTIGISEPFLGFNIQPFLNAGWYQAGDTASGRDQYTSSYGVTISHMLFNIAERIRQRLPLTTAETNFYIAANGIILQGKTVELETTRAFFNIQRAMEHVRVRERRVEDARQFLGLVEDNVKHGFKAPFETLTATINLNQAQTDLVGERATLQDAIERLARQLALPVKTPLMISPQDLTSAHYTLPDLEADLANLRLHHEDLGNRTAQITLQLDTLRVQRDQLAPQISAGVTGAHTRIGHQPFAGDLQDGTSWSLGFTWVEPLDFKASARAAVAEIEDQIHQSTLSLHDAQDDLEQQLRSAWRHINQLNSTVQLSLQRLEAERGNLEATLSRWQSGAIDNLEVTRSKQDLDNAEIQLLDARCDLAIRVAEYRAILPAPTTIDGRAWNRTGPNAPAIPLHGLPSGP